MHRHLNRFIYANAIAYCDFNHHHHHFEFDREFEMRYNHLLVENFVLKITLSQIAIAISQTWLIKCHPSRNHYDSVYNVKHWSTEVVRCRTYLMPYTHIIYWYHSKDFTIHDFKAETDRFSLCRWQWISLFMILSEILVQVVHTW